MVNVDRIATMLADGARMARAMPPIFEGAGIAQPVMSPDGVLLGRALPGLGLALALDAKTLGITRPIPHVFEATALGRAIERADRTRRVLLPGSDDDAPIARSLRTGAFLSPTQVAVLNLEQKAWEAAQRRRATYPLNADITSMDAIVAQRAAGYADDVYFAKTAIAGTTVANAWYHLFLAGGNPSAGSYTSNPGAVLTRADTGALSNMLTNPAAGKKKFLLACGMGCFTQAVNWAWLVDLLIGCGNISLVTVTTVNITTMPALTRYTTGKGVLVFGDVTTALGTGTGTHTFNYTDQDGNTGQTTPAHSTAASSIVRSVVPNSSWVMPFYSLASGDYGVRAIASVAISAGHTSTGIIALNLCFPLMMVPGVAAGGNTERDAALSLDGLVELATASDVLGCLSLIVVMNTTSGANVTGQLRTVASS